MSANFHLTCRFPIVKRNVLTSALLTAVLPVLLTVVLSAITMAGCAAPSSSATSITPNPAGTPVATAVADVAQRVQALLPLDALLLGKQHDAPDHQRIHREVIEALAARGALAAVVLEMAMQGNSTASLAEPSSKGGTGASEDAVRAALRWDEQAWPWATYAPAIMAAVRAGVAVLGSNMPRAQMGAAMQQLELDQRLSGPALKAQQQLIRLGHCNLLPESQISPMTRIQIARDVAMANAIVQALASSALTVPTTRAATPSITATTAVSAVSATTPSRSKTANTVVLLAGSGHVDRRLGVPQHLPPGVKAKSVLLVAGLASDAGDKATDFDAVWAAAPVPAKDYCAGLKAKIKG